MNIPSPPSPASSPSLTQSASNLSSSPPQPTTPPRNTRNRYNDTGRVPLHRRGTSKTYEHLEDLLREAGYKETRIFTPESDKHGVGDRDEGSPSGSRKQGVGAAVVGFLTGLVTGGNVTGAAITPGTSAIVGGAVPELRQESLQQSDDNSRTQHLRLPQIPPPLPSLVAQHTQPADVPRNDESNVLQTPLMTSSIESLNEPNLKTYRRQNSSSYSVQHQSRPPSRPTTPSYYTHTPNQYQQPPTTTHYNHQPPQPRHRRLSAAQRQLQHQASRSSIGTHTGYSSDNNAAATISHIANINPGTSSNGLAGIGNVIHHPHPSRAGNYLRHMVSTPVPRPNSTPANRRTSRKDDSDIEAPPSQPSLPKNWLENVTRAILLGVTVTPNGTSNDTPPNNELSPFSHLPPPHQRRLRATRSSLSQTTIVPTSKAAALRRSGLSDQINTTSLQALTPPVLFTRLERGRATCSQSVLKAQVVCRSAPASRASSLVRQTSSSAVFVNRTNYDPGVGSGISGSQTRRRQQKGSRGSKVVGDDNNGLGRGRITNTRRNKQRKDEKTRVPSLARTHIEGDGWHESGAWIISNGGTSTLGTRNKASRHEDLSSGYDDDDDDGEEEEDDDGELDLAKMLVPPKRQHSIRSLRKHLHLQLSSPSVTDVSTTKLHQSLARLNDTLSTSALRPNSNRTGSGVQPRLSGMQEERVTSEWEHEWRRGEFSSRKASEDDEEVGTLAWLSRDRGNGSQRSTVKTRLTLPGLWNTNGGIQGHQ